MFNGDDFKCTNDTQLHTLLKILKLTKLFTSDITPHMLCDSVQEY